MESLAQQQVLPGGCSPCPSCTQSKAAGPGHPPWEASRDRASGLLSQTPRPPHSSSSVWLLVRWSSPADSELPRARARSSFSTPPPSPVPRYPVAATHRCHLQEQEVDLSNSETDWNELGRGFSVRGVRNRNRHLRNIGPNVPLKGTPAPQAGDGPIDLQVPARSPAQPPFSKAPGERLGQVATSGKGSEISRQRQGREGGGSKLPSAGPGPVLLTSIQALRGPSWSSIPMGGRERVSPPEK